MSAVGAMSEGKSWAVLLGLAAGKLVPAPRFLTMPKERFSV